jgi:hypothetical protein
MRTLQHKNWLTGIAAAGLLVCFAAQAVLSMKDKSVTVDEITYIAAGYYHLRTGDFHYNMTNPPLMKLTAALPLLLLNPELPETGSDPDGWNAIEEWQYARRFLYDNRVDADRMLFAARLPFVALGVVLGVLVFVWARELYGPRSGLLALFLYAFSPNILAHTRLTTQDLGVTLIVFSSSYFFWRYTLRHQLASLFASAAIVGCGILTKTTAGFVAPIFAVYYLAGALTSNDFGVDARFPWVARLGANQLRKRQLLTAAWIGVIFGSVILAVVNLGYGFQGSFSGIPLIPSAFERSILFQLRLSTFGGVFFAGKIYENGLWFILLPTILLKTPIPTLLLAAVAAMRVAICRRAREAEILIAAAIGVFIGLFMLLNNLGTILRYVLPIYPFAFVLIGRLATEALPYRPAVRVAGGALALWYLAGTLSVFPHYLAYFNELIGGPANGYKYLAESNLDWGQDLKSLKTYMTENGIDRITLGYFGSADADYYGIDYDYLPSVGLKPKKPGQRWWYEIDPDRIGEEPRPTGRIAVSVTLIQAPRWLGRLFEPTYGWLRDYEPIETIGHTIHIYDIPPEPREQP